MPWIHKEILEVFSVKVFYTTIGLEAKTFQTEMATFGCITIKLANRASKKLFAFNWLKAVKAHRSYTWKLIQLEKCNSVNAEEFSIRL